jgi:hypothetical protein
MSCAIFFGSGELLARLIKIMQDQSAEFYSDMERLGMDYAALLESHMQEVSWQARSTMASKKYHGKLSLNG